ncbi:Hypothetical protein GLP15_4446 [Giardia lamblia P15]|uniref:Uncharacterized protein n=1 Tax=Giardia intestinalis (strain P15) TaxID=658858 RepID=E1F5L3_GIAIA|nr:Hypothetical protein GLP15_4446 [Giardia lamblia P15]
MASSSRRNILVFLEEKMYLFANYPLERSLQDFRKDVLAQIREKKHSSILLGLIHDGSILKDSEAPMGALLLGNEPIIHATVVPVTPSLKPVTIFPGSLSDLYRILQETLVQTPIGEQTGSSSNTPSAT